nr:YbaK/EbsC family protein [Kineococcus indalonis]
MLAERGVAHTPHPYEHDPASTAYGEEAVRALRAGGLDVSAERVFKTLLADVDGRLVVAVVPVAATLDLKALAAAAGGRRAAMADPARAQRSSGYVLGGISPLGQRNALPTFVDASAAGFTTVLVSAGRRGRPEVPLVAPVVAGQVGEAVPVQTAQPGRRAQPGEGGAQRAGLEVLVDVVRAARALAVPGAGPGAQPPGGGADLGDPDTGRPVPRGEHDLAQAQHLVPPGPRVRVPRQGRERVGVDGDAVERGGAAAAAVEGAQELLRRHRATLDGLGGGQAADQDAHRRVDPAQRVGAAPQHVGVPGDGGRGAPGPRVRLVPHLPGGQAPGHVPLGGRRHEAGELRGVPGGAGGAPATVRARPRRGVPDDRQHVQAPLARSPDDAVQAAPVVGPGPAALHRGPGDVDADRAHGRRLEAVEAGVEVGLVHADEVAGGHPDARRGRARPGVPGAGGEREGEQRAAQGRAREGAPARTAGARSGGQRATSCRPGGGGRGWHAGTPARRGLRPAATGTPAPPRSTGAV